MTCFQPDGSMTKTKQNEAHGFGERLARMRKAAGYTQQELAAASGLSRRMIVYYEAQVQPPLAEVITKLAPLLNSNADAMLGLATPRKVASIADPRVARRLRAIDQLSAADKRRLLELIDAFVEHGRRKQSA